MTQEQVGVFEKAIAVRGTVSDELAGIGSVTVNGIPATVNNGQFYTNNIPITPGGNAITATATDNAGNTGSDTNNITLLSGIQTINYTYDNNGNLTSKSNLTAGVTTNYTYNYENMLTGVTRNASAVATYQYDGRNNRIAKTLSGETTRYIYDGPNTLEELDEAGGLKKTYTYGIGIDELLSTINHQLSTKNYFHTDVLGSVTSISDTAGNTVQEYSYDAFGEVRTQEGNIDNNYLFTAREWDDATGLYYYRARYYDARVGRFVQVDPIGYAGGINFYDYAKNNPINYSDPYGLTVIGGPLGPSIPRPGVDTGTRVRVRGCRPCIPSVGTKAYLGPHCDHTHGGLCPHYHYYKVNQVPYPDCTCHWNKAGYGKAPEGIPFTGEIGGGGPID